jgi:hypothetical protein
MSETGANSPEGYSEDVDMAAMAVLSVQAACLIRYGYDRRREDERASRHSQSVQPSKNPVPLKKLRQSQFSGELCMESKIPHLTGWGIGLPENEKIIREMFDNPITLKPHTLRERFQRTARIVSRWPDHLVLLCSRLRTSMRLR